MIAFHILGRPIYRYGIMYLIGFLVGYLFLRYVTKKNIIQKISPTLQVIMEGNVDLLLTYIIIGGILGGRLGEVVIYEWGYYSQHPGQILATWQGGMSFIGGIIGTLLAVSLFLWIQRPKQKLSEPKRNVFLTLTDLMAAITPFGIMLGRIGNFLNRELYGPVIVTPDTIEHTRLLASSYYQTGGTLSIGSNLYKFLDHLMLIVDYGTNQYFLGELRLNTNFLASFGEGFLLLIILQVIFWRHRRHGQLKAGVISGVFLICYSIVRFLLEYVRIDSLDDYIRGLTSTQWLSIVMLFIGIILVLIPRFKHR